MSFSGSGERGGGWTRRGRRLRLGSLPPEPRRLCPRGKPRSSGSLGLRNGRGDPRARSSAGRTLRAPAPRAGRDACPSPASSSPQGWAETRGLAVPGRRSRGRLPALVLRPDTSAGGAPRSAPGAFGRGTELWGEQSQTSLQFQFSPPLLPHS